MGMGMMTAITRLCMAGTRAIAETCRPDSQKRIDCLLDWNGSKIKAAAALGMSRATIYRKIREYGIVAPAK